MKKTIEIVKKIKGEVFGGAKIPHGISNPVLRLYNEKLYIAFFVYTFNKDNISKNEYQRPLSWVLADISDGAIIKEFECKLYDFSDESFDEVYSFTDSSHDKPDIEYITAVYSLLDAIRTEYIENNNINLNEYNNYIESIKSITPLSYRVFYDELNGVE